MRRVCGSEQELAWFGRHGLDRGAAVSLASMRRRAGRYGCFAATVCLAVAAVVPIVVAQPIRSVDGAAITDYLEQVRHATGAPGITAAVAIDGEVVYSGGVGYGELDNRTPADGATVLNAGSISKVMTAVATMQLVERNSVRLDQSIRQFVPSFPDKQVNLTLQHILTHTSGIRHYREGEFGPYGLTEMRRFDSIDEAIAIFKDDPLLFPPGRFWSYSSHAFNLLQGVVERASGTGFETYMRTRIWEPAGMLSTSFDVPERIVHRRGRGYDRDEDGRLVNSRYVDVSYKYASGGMLTTVQDLVRFGMALNDGTLLEPATLARMYAVAVDPVLIFSPNGDPQPGGFRQAIGWRLDRDVQGRTYISHTGTVRGTRSVLINYPEHGLVVALQANSLPFDSQVHGQAIAQMFLPPAHGTSAASGGARR